MTCGVGSFDYTTDSGYTHHLLQGEAEIAFAISAKTSYAVKYNANGGSSTPAQQTKWYGENLTLAAAISRSGFNFKRWNTNTSDTGTGYNASATYSGNAALTLYAIWNHTLSYNLNGGSASGITNQTALATSAITVTSVVPTLSNYTFKRWNTNTSDTGTGYNSGGSFAANTANTTIYAIWNRTVTYDANGGSGAPASQTAVKTSAITLSSNVPEMSGYSFVEWNTAADGTGDGYAKGGSYPADHPNVTLYAIYGPAVTGITAVRTDSNGDPDDLGGCVKVTFTATNLASYNVTVGDVSTGTVSQTEDGTYSEILSGTLSTFDPRTAYTVTVTVTSSDNVSTTATSTLPATVYASPRIVSILTERCDENGNANDDGEHVLLTLKWSAYSAPSQSVTLTFNSTPEGSTEPIAYQPVSLTAPGGTSAIMFPSDPLDAGKTFDTNLMHVVSVVIEDVLDSATISDVVSRAFFTMDVLGDAYLYQPSQDTAIDIDKSYYVNMEANSASASARSFSTDDALERPLLTFSAIGESVQGTTTGKNLLESQDLYTGTVNNSYYSDFLSLSNASNRIGDVELEGGVTYTLTADVESSVDNFNFSVGVGNGTYAKDIYSIEHLHNGRINLTFTPNASILEQYGNKLAFRAPRYGTPTSYTYKVSNIQLEVGSTATSYEPYTGGKPSPSPDYPQEIRVVKGRNLLKLTGRTVRPTTNCNPTDTRTMDGTGIWTNTASNGYVRDMVSSYSVTDDSVTLTINSDNKAYGIGFEYPVTPGEQYTISYNGTNASISCGYFNLSGVNVSSLGELPSGFVLTVPDNAAFLLVVVRCTVANGTGTATNIQLESGSTATPYVPYGHVGLEIQGFNLWDEQWEVGSIDANTGQNVSTTGRIRSTNYIPVAPSTTYYLIVPIGTFPVFFYDENKNYITPSFGDVTGLFTTPANARYMRFRTGSNYGGTYNNNICLNVSNPERNGEYEPYYHSTTPVPIPEEGLVSARDGTKDLLNIDSAGHVTADKRVQKITVDGTNVKFFRVNLDSGIYQAAVYIPTYGSSGTNYSALSNRFLQTTSYTSEGILVRDSFINIQSASLYTTVEEANTWAVSNPTDVYYKLKTPTTIDLGYIDLPQVVDGSTVYVDAEVQPIVGGSWWTESGSFSIVPAPRLADISVYYEKNGPRPGHGVAFGMPCSEEGFHLGFPLTLGNGENEEMAIRYHGPQRKGDMIRFIPNNNNDYGDGIVIGGGGAVIIGSGESAEAVRNAIGLSAETETTYITSDEHINFVTRCRDIGNRKVCYIDNNGDLTVRERMHRYSNTIHDAKNVVSSNTIASAMYDFDGSSQRIGYSEVVRTNVGIYRSFCVTNPKNNLTCGIYLHAHDNGTTEYSFTSAPAFRTGLGLGSFATKNNLNAGYLAKDKTITDTSARASGANFTISIAIGATADYMPIAVVAAKANSGSVVIRGFDLDGLSTGANPTLLLYCHANAALAANTCSYTAQVMLCKTTLV